MASINLAALVSDGQQVVVGVPGAAAGAGNAGVTGAGGAGGAGGGSSGPLDLNAATLEELEGLPGVGPVLAQRILDWRTAHGHFSDVGELREVGGIGERKYAEIAPRVRA
jgi:competence protein ComEA